MGIIEKIVGFFAKVSVPELILLGVLILFPLLAVVLLIVAIVKRAIRRRAAKEDAALEENTRIFENDDEVNRRELVYVPAEQPAPKRVRTVDRVKVKVKVEKLNKPDAAMLAATGIFCVGLGFMLHRAFDRKKKF